MATTVRVDYFTGDSPTAHAWPAGGRFHRDDSTPTTDAETVPVPVPNDGLAYSWRKSLKLNVLTPPLGSISNLRFFGDGTSWGSGVTPYVKKQSSYRQASNVDSIELFDSAAVALSTYSSGSPLVVNAGTVLTGTTGYGTQDYVVMQLAIGPTATPPQTSARTLTYRYDES